MSKRTSVIVYDSGVGAEYVAELLKHKLIEQGRQEEFVISVFSDTAHFPYGTKTSAELFDIVKQVARRFELSHHGPVLVACNSASIVIDQHPAEFLKTKFQTIIQPAIRAIVRADVQKVRVIATDFTFSSHVYLERVQALDMGIECNEQAEQQLVNDIQSGRDAQAHERIKQIVASLSEDQALVLGCTHFSKVKWIFEQELSAQYKKSLLIDPAEELVREFVGW